MSKWRELAIKLIMRRVQFIKKMEKWANQIHQQITQQREHLTIEYIPSFPLPEDCSLEDGVQQFTERLKQIQDKEIARGASLLGPHRDDLTFFINNASVQQFGSQGQQRTTALSLKLAEIQLIYQEVGEYPILLLDDVLSELDTMRQTHLLDAIKDKVQTFVTTTGVEGLHHQTLLNASIFFIQEGEAIKEK